MKLEELVRTRSNQPIRRITRSLTTTWMVIALILVGGRALAQCNISASIVNRPGENYSPLALEIVVAGGTIGNTASIELFNSGALYARRSEGSLGTLTRDVGLGCGFDASGEWTWQVSAVCVNFDPSLPSDDPRQSKNTFANSNGGPFFVTWIQPTMQAEILNPPEPRGNVKITWSFPSSIGQGRAIWIDGGQLGLNSPPSEGEYIFNLSAGRHTISQRWCIQSNGNAASSGFDVVVPPGPTPADPGTFRFDLQDTEQVRVLTHRYGDDTYPTIFGDQYPSPLQTQDRAIKVQGTVTDASGRPASGKTVYFRVTDPADPSAYVPRSDRTVDDNIDGRGRLNGGAPTANVVSDAQGRISVTLNVSDHVAGDNYQLEASMKPDFTCGAAGCAKSATYTAWKRVYVEVEKMFKRGAFIRANVPVGATSIQVTDVNALATPPFDVRMIHAAKLHDPADFYDEVVRVIGVRRAPDPQRALPFAGVLMLDPATPVTHKYLMGESVGGSVLDYLADALGVVTGSRDTDYYLPLASLMPKAFDPMFVEHVWLTDATTTDHPDLLDSQDRIRFDGAIPFEAVLDKPGLGNESELLFKKWARNVQRAGDLRSALHNHQVLISTSKHAIDPDEFMGLTEAGGGRNHTFVFVKSATSTNERREVVVHELTHQWRVNNSGQGHCNLTGRRQDRRMWDHSTLLCTMTSKIYPSLESTDGVVGFHYVKESGVVDSELTFIRQRPEPVPQNTP